MSLLTRTRSDETTSISSIPVVLPRVNLLPPEIFERRQVRRIQTGLGGAVLGAVAIVGILLVSASAGVSSAQSEADAAAATGTQLRVESAKYNDVNGVYNRAAAAQAMLAQAMGEEVRYSRFLSDLSLSIPENVWLKNLTFTQAAPTAAGAAGAAVPGVVPGIGTVTFTGVGFSHEDVAVWLESLASQKGYVSPTFSSSTEALLGTRKIVNFTSNATLTADAYSGDYTKPAGG